MPPLQLSSAQPFNQAQFSPEDSQQEPEVIQPNIPCLPPNKADKVMLGLQPSPAQCRKQSRSGVMLLSLPSKGSVIRLKRFLFQEVCNRNTLQILFIKNNSVLQWRLMQSSF